MSVQKRKILEGDYRVSHIVGAVREGSGRSLIVRWEGYNYLGDTREPEEHVRPRSKVQKYDAGIPLTVDLSFYIGVFRNAIAAL